MTLVSHLIPQTIGSPSAPWLDPSRPGTWGTTSLGLYMDGTSNLAVENASGVPSLQSSTWESPMFITKKKNGDQ